MLTAKEIRREYLIDAKRQQYYSTLAHKEALYSHKKGMEQKKKHHPIIAQDFFNEEKVANYWSDRRAKVANGYRHKALSNVKFIKNNEK